MRKTSAMSLWRWFPWSFCCVKCRHICVKRILYEAHTHQYIYSSESRGYSRDIFTLLLFTSGSWPSIHKAAESLNALHKYIPWCCDYICLAQALKSWKISLGSALKCECRGFKLGMTNTAARCCILSQIDNKAWQLWRLAWEKEKSKKKKSLCVARLQTAVLILARGEHCPNTVRTGSSIWSFCYLDKTVFCF